jgi:hypothetical protein
MGKTLPKHKLDARLTRKTMCKRELTIVHRLRKILMLPVSSIATAVNRDKNTIYAALRRNQNANLARLGRPPAMTNAQVYAPLVVGQAQRHLGGPDDASMGVVSCTAKLLCFLRWHLAKMCIDRRLHFIITII